MSIAHEESGAEDQPTMPLVSTGSADSCMVCGAHLASDQRYCVECGTRRGASRFQLASPTGSQYQAPAYAPQATGGLGGLGRGPRMNSSILLLATVLIVLLAVGVGVLIGHDNSSPKQTKQPISVVVNGGGSGSGSSSGSSTADSATGNTGATSSSGTTSKSSGSKSSKSAKGSSKSAAATKANASAKGKSGAAKAAKSFSSTATKKSTLGGSCVSGTAGCSNGKQTGTLFGG